MSAESKDSKYDLASLKNTPIPEKMRLRVGNFGLTKDGDNLYYMKLNTLISTMPGEPTEKMPPEERLDLRLMKEFWDVIKVFDFAAYKNLKDDDLIEDEAAASMCDAKFVWPFGLNINEQQLISCNFALMKPKDGKLDSERINLNERLHQVLQTDRAKKILKEIKIPNKLLFRFGYDIALERKDGKDYIRIRRPFEEFEKYPRLDIDGITKLCSKDGKMVMIGNDFAASIDEREFLKFWEEIKKIDLIRFVNVSENDFDFTKPAYTSGLHLALDDKIVVDWCHVDRLLKKKVSAPLDGFNKLLEDKFHSIVDELKKK